MEDVQVSDLNVIKGYYGIEKGCFAFLKKDENGNFVAIKTPDDYRYRIHSCRELFHIAFLKEEYNKNILFALRKNNFKEESDNLIVFFDKLEQKLEIKKEDRTTFNSVAASSSLVLITVSDFWRSEPLRQQVFSLVLKSFLKSQDFECIINYCYHDDHCSVEQIANHKYALSRFLDGYTSYNKEGHKSTEHNYFGVAQGYGYVKYGWFSRFANSSKEDIDESLLKP